MANLEQFHFDLAGPLELYGCGRCGSDRIGPYGSDEILCLDCKDITTPEQWLKWCNDRRIDPELGPFLQALKNVRERAGLSFDLPLARKRYMGDSNLMARERALTNRQLRDEYAQLRSRKPIVPLTLEEL